MAISLNDVKKSKAVRNKPSSSKKRSLRPWENFSNTPDSLPVKSSSAREAVIRARKIAKKNEQMVAGIRKKVLGENDVKEKYSAHRPFHGKEAFLIKKNISSTSYKIKTKKNLFGLIREIFEN